MSQMRLQPLISRITVPLRGRHFYQAMSIVPGAVAQHLSFGDTENVSSSTSLHLLGTKQILAGAGKTVLA
jgi:hypothetical protein